MARDTKAYKGMAMEGIIADWYAKNTKGDARGYRKTIEAIVDRLTPGASVLEVAPGPGYLAIDIARLGPYQVSGLDISKSFVRIAAENARRAGVSIDLRLGDAAHMPFADESFDFVVCRAAFKNFTNPVGAIDEIYRVLRPGGKASIIDLRKNASLQEIDEEVDGMRLSWLNALLTRLTFRTILLKNAYTTQDLERMVSESRFGQGEIRKDGIGFDLRLAKSSDPATR